MDVVLFNISWMLYNISLALIAVLFGWLTFKSKTYVLKIFFGIIWILFLPNTIYLLTDIEHYFEEILVVKGIDSIFLTLQYGLLMILGVATFLVSMYPLEMILRKEKRKKSEKTLIIILLNLLVAFGMVLGRVQRTNSWDVVFNSTKVISDIYHILITPQLLLLFIFFGILCNIIFFIFRKSLLNFERILY